MEKIIKSIRKHIRENKLSFLIGSGFSKNASLIYPDWSELMTDVLDYLYDDKIKLSYKQCDQSIDYAEYKADYLNQIVSELGYLRIASEYVRRKQYREAIDIYIENHIPFATKRGAQYIANGHKLNLDLHRRLLSLNAQNIYTFNYDNLLELASGADKVKENHAQRDKICKILRELCIQIEDYNSQYRELSANIDFKDVKTDGVNDLEQSDLTQIINQINNIVEKINNDYALSLKPHTTQDNDSAFSENNKILKEKTDLLSSQQKALEDTLDQGYLPVTKSWEISLTEKTRNIFKLHGDLRGHKKDIYGFDGDNHKHYVITQEDYETYQQKHEAFVNLMRISLLKGVFCAIGFGGDDPNFLAWISWVRDILDKGKADRGSSDTKIYFVDVSDHQLSEERKQLFVNHNIEHVRLCNIYGNKTPYKLLNEFLSDIASGSVLQSYKDAWDDLPWERKYGNVITKDQVFFSEKDANYLIQLCEKNKFPSIKDSASTKRDNILSYTSFIIDSEHFNINSAKVIYAAIKGQLLPLDYVITAPKHINLLKGVCASDQYMSDRIKMLQVRDDILFNKTIKLKLSTNEYKYEECLQSAFRLDFRKFKNQLTQWNPQDKYWSVKKNLLGSILDHSEKTFENDLKMTPEPEDFSCTQEYIYAMECMERVRFYFDDSINGKIKKIISQDSNNVWLYDKLDDFKQKLRKDPEKVIPYQDSNRVVSQSKSSSDFELSIQLMQTFIELGLPMQRARGILFNNTGWYPAFRQLYDTYPFPCLYYSLQYGSDDNFLKRIAQDFIYSDINTSTLEQMLEYMLKALLIKETPFIIREGIYTVAPAFMLKINSQRWFGLFQKFYNKCDINKYGDDSRFDKNERDFIVKGLEMCLDSTFKLSVLQQCLNMPNLTHFHNSVIIPAKSGLKQLNEDIINALNPIIERVDSMSEFYILFNLSDYFTDIQQQHWVKRLSEYSKYDTSQSVMIEAASGYANMSAELMSKIKHSMLSCNRLWKSDRTLTESGVSHGRADNIDLRRIKNIELSQSDIHKMYESLKESLKQIEILTDRGSDLFFSNDRKLLLKMIRFMEINRHALSHEDDFEVVVGKAVSLHYIQCGNKSLRELLVSSNGNDVDMGLQQLMFYVQMHGIEKYNYECILLSNIVLSQNNENLESCFDHFVYYIDKNREYFSKNDIIRASISSILKVYEPYFRKEPLDWDLRLRKSFAEELLILLNKIYSDW